MRRAHDACPYESMLSIEAGHSVEIFALKNIPRDSLIGQPTGRHLRTLPQGREASLDRPVVRPMPLLDQRIVAESSGWTVGRAAKRTW